MQLFFYSRVYGVRHAVEKHATTIRLIFKKGDGIFWPGLQYNWSIIWLFLYLNNNSSPTPQLVLKTFANIFIRRKGNDKPLSRKHSWSEIRLESDFLSDLSRSWPGITRLPGVFFFIQVILRHKVVKTMQITNPPHVLNRSNTSPNQIWNFQLNRIYFSSSKKNYIN